MSAAAPAGWTVVVPVKHTSHGKSRLRADAQLARAIALDTLERIAAARRVERIVLVTSDAALADAAREQITSAVVDVVAEETAAPQSVRSARADRADAVEHALNDAVRAGLNSVGGGFVAVIHADLPALHPDDLDDALLLAADVPYGAVSDSEGVGTVMLTAQHPRALQPSFGHDSFARHLAAGATPLAAAPSLRRDVDTPVQLNAARDAPELTLGPRTRALTG